MHLSGPQSALHPGAHFTLTPCGQASPALAGCARLRDWQHPLALEELVGFVAGDLMVGQGRLMAGVEQAGRGGGGGYVGSADGRESEEVGI